MMFANAKLGNAATVDVLWTALKGIVVNVHDVPSRLHALSGYAVVLYLASLVELKRYDQVVPALMEYVNFVTRVPMQSRKALYKLLLSTVAKHGQVELIQELTPTKWGAEKAYYYLLETVANLFVSLSSLP
jgi:hypothetical protein